MTESVFDDKAHEPDEAALSLGLGRRIDLWSALVETVGHAAGSLTSKWSFYTKATGWILLLQRRKKTVCTLIPRADGFHVIFLLPERAVEAARAARLPRRALEAMEAAKRYAMGRPFRVEVRRRSDLPAVRKLTVVKVESWTT